MDEHVVTAEQRQGELDRLAKTQEAAGADTEEKIKAQLESLSVADRLMRQHQQRSFLLTREDEGGPYGFHARQISSLERDTITGWAQFKVPTDPLKVSAAVSKLYLDIRAKAAEVTITPEVREYISSGKSPDSFNLWVLQETMSLSTRALEVIKHFRPDSGR